MKKIFLYFLLLYSVNAAGQDTISYKYGGCTDDGFKAASDNSCPPGVFFEYEKDSLTISGTLGTNCCGTHLAIVGHYPDTIYINTVDTGMLCTCVCGRCFEIKIPASVTDTLVNLNGTVYNTQRIVSTVKSKIENNILLAPNPVKTHVKIRLSDYIEDLKSIELIDSQGVVLNTIKLNREDQINVDLSSLHSGEYFFRFTFKNDMTLTKTIIKN